MKYSKKLSILLVSFGLVGGAFAQQEQSNMAMHTASHAIFTPETIHWGPAPAGLPSGAEAAVLEGNPAKKGPFTVRLKLPANYQIPAHTHPGTERVTVISGALHLGYGNKLDTTAGTVVPAGGFAIMQPGDKHFAWTDQETIVQLNGMGPWDIKYANPSDDPRKKK
jgi:hypothetical protein